MGRRDGGAALLRVRPVSSLSRTLGMPLMLGTGRKRKRLGLIPSHHLAQNGEDGRGQPHEHEHKVDGHRHS